MVNGWKNFASLHHEFTQSLANLIVDNKISTFGLNLMNAIDPEYKL